MVPTATSPPCLKLRGMTASAPPPLLALDVSKRRIGFAVNHGLLVFGRGSLARTRLSADLKRVQKLAAKEGTQALVLGLPKSVTGQSTPETDRVLAFGRALREVGFAVHYQDERFTTARARTAGASDLDEGAASEILTMYLQSAGEATQPQSTPKEAPWPAKTE